MQNQGSNVAPLTVEECLARVDRWEVIDLLTAKGSQFSRRGTGTSSCMPSSKEDSNLATHQASQNRNSECTAVPKNPENEGDIVPKTVNLATFEDRIAALEECCYEVRPMTTSVILSRLERLEYTLQTYKATSDKTLDDRAQLIEPWRKHMMQTQMGTPQAQPTDSAELRDATESPPTCK